jgi:hypothetical protein
MKKLLATLIAGFLVTGAFAQSPAAPTAATTGASTAPVGEGTAADKKASTPKPMHMKHKTHAAKAMAK